jgi:hypothetical protein
MRFNLDLFLLSAKDDEDVAVVATVDTFVYQGNCCMLANKRNLMHQVHLRGRIRKYSPFVQFLTG